MSQRAGQKLESKRRIVQAAAKLLRAKGVTRTSVEKAMRGAKLTVGGFYAHFESKDDLLSQAFGQALDDMDGVLRNATRGRTGRAAVGAVAGTYLSEEHMVRVEKGCPLPAVAGEAASVSEPKVHRLLAGGVATMRARLVAVASGEIDADTALALCGLLMAACSSAARSWRAPLGERRCPLKSLRPAASPPSV